METGWLDDFAVLAYHALLVFHERVHCPGDGFFKRPLAIVVKGEPGVEVVVEVGTNSANYLIWTAFRI